ncbi:antitoxin MazE7 [Streptomyces sp. NPDC001536]|uniref:antitoxin MazE7 n=1 Tax=Streptomyces sp. NPDC001536 TaxID=3364583 RepID=UPI0036B2D7D2
MADIEIDRVTRDTLEALAEAEGLPLADYLAKVAEEKHQENVLAEGAAIFRRVTGDPATVASFDAEFGGPAQVDRAPRAA